VNSIQVRNVNSAYAEAAWMLRSMGVKEDSRNGPVMVMPGPFCTTYSNPLERVLFNRKRDANHVFHLVESIWMLAGRDDAEFLLPFNSQYGKYAEADGRVHGAYGHRWRVNFGADQLLEVVHELRRDSNTRRAVLAMWDPVRMDMRPFNDTPCNTHIYFDLRGGVLNMTVCNRSNDMVWGAYGANVVHMSFLQELIAGAVGAPVGAYRQFSNNFHIYMERHGDLLETPPSVEDLYASREAFPYPLYGPEETIEDILEDCESWTSGALPNTTFLSMIVDPLAQAYLKRKKGERFDSELAIVPNDCDWKIGFQHWMENRDAGK
jgi:thymidylate synthase